MAFAVKHRVRFLPENKEGGDRVAAARKRRSVRGGATSAAGDLLVAPVEVPGAVDGPEA